MKCKNHVRCERELPLPDLATGGWATLTFFLIVLTTFLLTQIIF